MAKNVTTWSNGITKNITTYVQVVKNAIGWSNETPTQMSYTYNQADVTYNQVGYFYNFLNTTPNQTNNKNSLSWVQQ